MIAQRLFQEDKNACFVNLNFNWINLKIMSLIFGIKIDLDASLLIFFLVIFSPKIIIKLQNGFKKSLIVSLNGIFIQICIKYYSPKHIIKSSSSTYPFKKEFLCIFQI